MGERKSERTYQGRSAPDCSIAFWDKVDKSDNGCWLWIAAKNEHGYGCFRYRNVLYKAHRVAWEQVNGTIQNDKFVLHRCDNPSCVNPLHLFLGTQLDNMRDMLNKGRNPRSIKTHCKRGHPYDGENLIRRYDGGRDCRLCSDMHKKSWAEKRRQRASQNNATL